MSKKFIHCGFRVVLGHDFLEIFECEASQNLKSDYWNVIVISKGKRRKFASFSIKKLFKFLSKNLNFLCQRNQEAEFSTLNHRVKLMFKFLLFQLINLVRFSCIDSFFLSFFLLDAQRKSNYKIRTQRFCFYRKLQTNYVEWNFDCKFF